MAKRKKTAKKVGGPFLAAAVFCESVVEDASKKISAINILDGVQMWLAEDAPADIPSKSKPITVIQNVLIIFRTGDASGKHELRLVIQQPDGKRSEALKQQIELTTQSYGGCNIKTQATLRIFSSGVYWIDVILNGTRFTRMPINVLIKRLPSMTADNSKGNSKK